jgi:hypothetical protein
MSALDHMLQQVQAPLGYKPYSQTYMPRQPGFLESFLTGLPSVGSMFAGDYMKSRAMGGL